VEKIIYIKIQQHYCPKVVGAHDGNKDSLGSVLKLMEAIVEPLVAPIMDIVSLWWNLLWSLRCLW